MSNKIPMSETDLIKFVHKKLFEFDKTINTTGKVPEYNPYTEPIIFISKKKFYMVPLDTQLKAVTEWTHKNKTIKRKRRNTNKHTNNYDFDYIKLIILIIAALLALYFFFTIETVPYGISDEHLRYIITKD